MRKYPKTPLTNSFLQFDAEPNAYNDQLELALKDLKHTDTLVIDIRINFGGSDALAAMDTVTHFIRHHVNVAQKTAR